jgi:hypothetical protein
MPQQHTVPVAPYMGQPITAQNPLVKIQILCGNQLVKKIMVLVHPAPPYRTPGFTSRFPLPYRVDIHPQPLTLRGDAVAGKVIVTQSWGHNRGDTVVGTL